MPEPGLDTQVLVVGAGPVGLLLAGELRLGGAEVTVLETLTAPSGESRATTLNSRTMEILDSRGLLDGLGTVPDERYGHFAGIRLDLALPGPWPGQWKLPQPRTEELLYGWATGLGARVLRGHTVVAVAPGAEHVDVEVATAQGRRRLRAAYVVGCDGQDSAVRRLTGVAFPGTAARRRLLRADVTGVDVPDRRFERHERGLAIAATRSGVTRVMVHEFADALPDTPPGSVPDSAATAASVASVASAASAAGDAAEEALTAVPDFAQVCAAWQRVTGEDLSGGTALWVDSFHDANRQAARYRDGRVLLAGDAAHQQMPVGGQAINLGLQDAFNLGWKLALRVRGSAGDALLDSYHDERHPVGAAVLANIRAQSRLLLGGPDVEPVRALFTEILRTSGSRTLASVLSGTDLRYPGGYGEHDLLGARFPHTALVAGGRRASSTELLRSGRGVLIDLSGGSEMPRPAEPWRDRVDHVTAALAPAAATSASDLVGPGALRHGDRVLLRPDGHLVWAGRSPQAAAQLRDALHRWFGEPARSPAAARR